MIPGKYIWIYAVIAVNGGWYSPSPTHLMELSVVWWQGSTTLPFQSQIRMRQSPIAITLTRVNHTLYGFGILEDVFDIWHGVFGIFDCVFYIFCIYIYETF